MKVRHFLLLVLAGQTVPARADTPVDYARDIKPILAARCYECHGALRQKGGLRLDTAAAILAGGDSGAAVVPGKSAESLLLGAVTGTAGFRMPPAGEGEPLAEAQVKLLIGWIDSGANSPVDEVPPSDPKSHWAYQIPRRPAVPAVRDATWARNPIDAFLAADHDAHGLVASPVADRQTLLRRAYVDLIGLPPAREELIAFVADESADAYERVVDQLLDSPRHGERWGRHWMDVWRYSDWYGKRDINQHRNSRKNIWRWRDWIIESVNAGKGYDRMILEMLAGDELAPGDDDVERATGYLGRNYYVYNRHVWLQDTVEYTGMAILGTTFKCCRCHDHKYDPITQEEYYQLSRLFEPYNVRTDRLPGRPATLSVTNSAGTAKEEVLKEGFDRVFDAEPGATTYILTRGNEKSPRTDRAIEPGVPAVLGGKLSIQPMPLPLSAYYPDLRSFVEEENVAALDAKTAAAQSSCDKAMQELAAAKKTDDAAKAEPGAQAATTAGPSQPADDAKLATLESAAALAHATLAAARADSGSLRARYAADHAKYEAVAGANAAGQQDLAQAAAQAEREASLSQAERAATAARHELLIARQEAKPDDDKTQKRVVAAEKSLADVTGQLETVRKKMDEPATSYTPVGPVYPAASTGRRLALARWITGRDNPLTARVAVNHIWMRHFGVPLVASVENFGLRGSRPTHPALLDWLAVELVEHNWSMKHLHRLIVTSQEYRMQSLPAASTVQNVAIDPENRYLWRANTRRVEAEVIRDGFLVLAGKLDASTGGPDLEPGDADRLTRRSIYFRHTPDDKPTLVELFDAANPVECYRRIESVVPQQALVLANGRMSLDYSRLVARIASMLGDRSSEDDDDRFVAAAFEHVLSRGPTPDERAKCGQFLARQAALLRDASGLQVFDGDATDQVPPAADPHARAHEDLVHVLFNHHDFVTVH